MTGEQALNLLMLRYGNRTAAALRANSLTEMVHQQTMLELASELPWFLIGAEDTLTITAPAREVDLPPGFLREVDEIPFQIVDSGGNRQVLEKKDYAELVDFHTFEATSELPENYALVGTKLVLFPSPLTTTSIKCRVYKSQQAPTDNTAVGDSWLVYAPDLLIAVTGEAIAGRVLKDPELTQLFIMDKQAAYARLVVDNTARAEAGRTRSMG